jgi:pimeloyl-ACP methyl ester carboxylesterase
MRGDVVRVPTLASCLQANNRLKPEGNVMQRRQLFQAATAAMFAAVAAPRAQAATKPKPKIIMVHGSWHWGGCFQKVADRLALAGYPVATPDLTSHGYNSAAYDSFKSIEDYAQPVEAILKSSSEKVVLVGHSMGGVTLTYLAEKYPEKISKLIYLTAFMAPKGKKAVDYILLYLKIPAAKELFQVMSEVNDGRGVKLDLTQRAVVKAAFYADCSEHDVDIAAKNVLPIQSSVPNQTVSTITAKRFGSIPRVYIECTEDKAIPIETQRLMISDVPGATVASLKTSHSSFFSQPDSLAKLIIEMA